MSRRRDARLNEQVRREVADILHQHVNDPRVGPVTVTGVRVTPDLQQARIFVIIPGDDAARRETLAGLAAAAPYVRTELARRLAVRRVPELRFEVDESLDYGMRIERLLKEVRGPDEPAAGDDAAGRAAADGDAGD